MKKEEQNIHIKDLIEKIISEIISFTEDGSLWVGEILKQMPLSDTDITAYMVDILEAIKKFQGNQEQIDTAVRKVFEEIEPLCCPISADPKEWDGNMNIYEDPNVISRSRWRTIMSMVRISLKDMPGIDGNPMFYNEGNPTCRHNWDKRDHTRECWWDPYLGVVVTRLCKNCGREELMPGTSASTESGAEVLLLPDGSIAGYF